MVRRRGYSMLHTFLKGRKKKRRKEVQQEESYKRGKSISDDKKSLKMLSTENSIINESTNKGLQENSFDIADNSKREEQSNTIDFKEDDDLSAEFLSSSSFDEELDNFDEDNNCNYKNLHDNLEFNTVYEVNELNTNPDFQEFYNRIINKFPNLESELQKNLKVLNNFFNKILSYTPKFKSYEERIFSILENCASHLGSNSYPKLGKNLFNEIFSHDPRVILGEKFSRNKLEDLFEDEKARNEIFKALKSHLISENRALIAFNLLRAFIVPQVACGKFKVPVLIGPPAGGKTLIPRVIVEVLSDFQLKVGLHVQDVEFDRGANDDLEMSLLGIDRHWANATPGTIYNLTKEIELLIVVLDEIDKKVDRRIFLKLFDQDKPLQDVYISGFCTNMNLRYKVAFICTGNENNLHYDLALKSRISLIEVKPYTFEEKLAILTNILSKQLKDWSKEDKNLINEVMIDILRKNPDLDVRELLGLCESLKSIIKYRRPGVSVQDEIQYFISSINLTPSKDFSKIKQRVGFV